MFNTGVGCGNATQQLTNDAVGISIMVVHQLSLNLNHKILQIFSNKFSDKGIPLNSEHTYIERGDQLWTKLLLLNI
jgi:hypothetical protein